MHDLRKIQFKRPYRGLFDGFGFDVPLDPLKNPVLLDVSPRVAQQLGLTVGDGQHQYWADFFTAQPHALPPFAVATVYSGHQFGQYNPRLGDGRAACIGELESGGSWWEIQTKGGGLTPFSRMGDGRAVLRSSIREYLCSEAMQGLGIPTTQALCLVGSETPVWRETREFGALVVRVAPSFIRFGHFEYFSHTGQHEPLKRLADYTIERYFPMAQQTDEPYLAFFDEVVRRTAALLAQWQSVGFTHGVMNSDNMSILGLTLDYGPFGFMDDYKPGYIPNHSDHTGRYAYDEQPGIGLFNCACLGQALMPLVSEGALRSVLDQYEHYLSVEYSGWMRAKMGFAEHRAEDRDIMNALLNRMANEHADFTNTFRVLSEYDHEQRAPDALRDLFIDRDALDAWYMHYRAHVQGQHESVDQRLKAMQAVNPKYVLRNYLAQQAITAAEQGDASELIRLRQVLERPYRSQENAERYAAPAPDWGKDMILSCSS